jgi:hypothetical protein
MPVKPDQRIELQNRFFAAPSRRGEVVDLVFILVVVPLAVVALATYCLVPFDALEPGAIVELLRSSSYDMLKFVLTTAVVGGCFYYAKRARRLERLILTDTEIRYQSAMPRALQRLQPDWSVRWHDVVHASLKSNSKLLGRVELVLSTTQGERRLRPYQWVEVGDDKLETPREAMRSEELRRSIADSPVVRLVAEHITQFRADAGWEDLLMPFALEHNRHALSTAVAMLGLLAYMVVDLMLNQETYASPPSYGVFVTGGIVAAFIAWLWLTSGGVPAAERVFLALLFGGVFGAALYPGLLRINQLTDSEGLREHTYVMQRDLSLAPTQAGLPVLSFPQYSDYWQQFPRGSTHEFRLRRGALGFYQVDMGPVNKSMRAWYMS